MSACSRRVSQTCRTAAPNRRSVTGLGSHVNMIAVADRNFSRRHAGYFS